MLNSLTGGVLRGLAGIALFVLVPLSAAAQDPLTCRAWTDNPIVSGSTPLRAEHINEIRACLERIIQHLAVMPVDPVGDITVTDVLKSDCSSWVCIEATFFNNRAEGWFALMVSDPSCMTRLSAGAGIGGDATAGGAWGGRTRAEVFYANTERADWYSSRGAAYYTIELTTLSGVPMLCSGCSGRRPW